MDKKDKFYRKFSTHEEQLAAAELFNKSFVDCQKEEQKPECDHIISIEGNGSGLSIYSQFGKVLDVPNPYRYTLKRCPECGEKLNLKKDE